MTASQADDDRVQRRCFTARALAQSHPLSPAAYRYRQVLVERERIRQPIADAVDWASHAWLIGYCLRRAEEADNSGVLDVVERAEAVWLERASAWTERLEEDADTVAALECLIATELDKRWDTAREHAGNDGWREIEWYLTWAVVHGYCLRAAETERGP